MKDNPFTSLIPFLILSLVLAMIGISGLAYVIFLTLPTLGPRWLFFFFLVIGISGLSLPIISFLHVRFQSNPPVTAGVIIRQSIWTGIFSGLIAWLQLGRVLNSPRAVFLATGFIIIEVLLRMRERSRFKPKETIHD